MLEPRVIRNDIFKTQQSLAQLEAKHGKASPEYQQALKNFARLWSVLKLTHQQNEFLEEIIS